MLKPKGKKQERRVVPWNPAVKWCSKRLDRAALRQALHRQEYDSIPGKRRIRQDNPLNWN